MARRGLKHPGKPSKHRRPRQEPTLFDPLPPTPPPPKPPRRKREEPEGPRILSVTALTQAIRKVLEPRFEAVWVKAELSNCSQPASGHFYCTLKDSQAQIRAVIWRSTFRRIRFDLADGQEILVLGRVSVYPPRGSYQLIIEDIEPVGLGALQKAFEDLKRKLQAEGLFEEERKKPLPWLPGVVGVVTSGTGAALRDILNVLHRRFPPLHVVVAPVRVQGEGSAPQIARAIRALDEMNAADVLIVGRGGGSLEDLWAFNEEPVVRAIAESQTPIISAVGHETDVTLSDFAADIRAPTPSAAAEHAVPLLSEVMMQLDELAAALRRNLLRQVEQAGRELQHLARSYALRYPKDRVQQAAQRVDELTVRLQRAADESLRRREALLENLAGRLEALSPLKVLGRGYSMTLDEEGHILTTADQIAEGAMIETRLSQGRLWSRIERREAAEPDEEGGSA